MERIRSMETQKVNVTDTGIFYCPIGTEIMLRIENNETQLKGSLIGMDRNEFLILKTPLTSEAKALLKVNTPVKGIFIHEGIIFGFLTRVLAAVSSPAPEDCFAQFARNDGVAVLFLFEQHQLRCGFSATMGEGDGFLNKLLRMGRLSAAVVLVEEDGQEEFDQDGGVEPDAEAVFVGEGAADDPGGYVCGGEAVPVGVDGKVVGAAVVAAEGGVVFAFQFDAVVVDCVG